MKPTAIAVLLIVSLLSCKPHADKIIFNANIYTLDSGFSKATTLVIEDGKIVEIGNDSTVKNKYECSSVIDANGKTVMPGFIDAHCHFTGYATDSWKCSLTGTKSFDEVVEKILAYSATAPTAWLYGRGWDQNDWDNKTFPDKDILDRLFPNKPVFLKRIDGHAALLNQKALDIAGINVSSKFEGGEVELKDGKLTGILVDNAMHFAEKKVPEIDDELAIKYYLQMQEKCFSYGLTGVHDCGVSEHTVDLLQKAHNEQGLKMKIYALLSDDTSYYEKWAKKGPLKTNRLHVGGFKRGLLTA
jgi:predicted amidohydrolase YtcJ